MKRSEEIATAKSPPISDGEIVAVRVVAATITVNFQTRNKQTTTPKGRTRRTIPMMSSPR